MGGGIMNRKMSLVLVVVIMIIGACTPYRPYEPTGNVVSEPDINVDLGEGEEEENLTPDQGTEIEDDAEADAEGEAAEEDIDNATEEVNGIVEVIREDEGFGRTADIIAYEGDLIDLKPMVSDPDGDEIKLGYTLPFDQSGLWQTKEGDAGFYSVIVTATDNKDSFVTKQFTITVMIMNAPPVIGIADTLEFVEGDVITLNPQITDSDGDEVVVTYSGWMTSRTYQTTYDDAGEYVVTIRANDGKEIVTKDVNIIVQDYNRPPSVRMISPARITVVEGEEVTIMAEATDPDGDPVEFMFSEPFSEDGTWQTVEGDAGDYEVSVTADDGVNQVVNEVLIEVQRRNTAPVIRAISITPNEVVLRQPGDEVTISIQVEAYDAEQDDLTVTYSGFMESAQKTVRYGERGGQKTVTVTVSDGRDSVSQDISFNMNNWPCFDCQ
jgi:hypothetical protein